MRIIAGTARGRRFDAPKGMDTRPTLDRVKEALFGSIQFEIPQSTVLDLFSGSGNLGLEAASRGASKVICNDYNRDCAEQIRKNAKLLSLDAVVQVYSKDFASCLNDLARAGEQFDFVFLDAPYQGGTAQAAADRVLLPDLLPRIVGGLLEPEGHAFAFLIDRAQNGLDCSININNSRFLARGIGWSLAHVVCPLCLTSVI